MLGNKQIPLVCLFLAVGALIAFWQVNECDFITYDDPSYVTENIHVRNGITTESIRWAFTTGYAANWHPVTWLSHMLDVQLFGLKPRWHHLTNLLFHIANTLLLFLIFHRMTKAPWKSAFVAALFALHPLHVESVAWVAERKDVLATFFWMLTMGAYIHYVEHPRLKNYVATLIFFVLGLMAKPMPVTLPFVLLLLDYWPLQRLGQEKSARETRTEASMQGTGSGELEPLSENKINGKSGDMCTGQGMVKEEEPAVHKYQWALIRPLLQEKIPFLALTALSCIVTYLVQQKGGAVKSVEAFPAGVRIANAFVSYIVYIGKTIWPANLAIYYPHPGLRPLWQTLVAVLFLIAVTISVIRTAKRFPYLTMGWLWFTGTLVPVIGIVQVGNQAMADRYTYIPLIGLFVMAAWGIPELLKKWRYRKEALFASSALILPCFFIVTWTQVGYWRNSIALYDYTLKVTSSNDLIQRSRGAVYYKLGNYTQAIEDFDRAVEINPEYAEAYYNRAVTYGKLGDHGQAISDYDRVVEIDPEHARAFNNRGFAYGRLGYHRQAILDYDRAIEIDPEFALAYINRGTAYRELGNQRQAISDYDRAIEINPKDAEAYYNRGVVYDMIGNNRQAIPDFDKAIEINPEYANAYNNRGVAYGKLGNHRQAISDFDRAIKINPEYADAYNNRGVVYGILRNQGQAIEDLQKAARLDSENAKNSLRSRGLSW